MLGSTLRKKGIAVPRPDLIIYTAAFNNNCSIWTRDQHFQTINEAADTGLQLFEPGQED